jgi:hypothetical protein
MPGSLLFTDKDDRNNPDTSPEHSSNESLEEEKQPIICTELTLIGNNVCFYYHY